MPSQDNPRETLLHCARRLAQELQIQRDQAKAGHVDQDTTRLIVALSGALIESYNQERNARRQK